MTDAEAQEAILSNIRAGLDYELVNDPFTGWEFVFKIEQQALASCRPYGSTCVNLELGAGIVDGVFAVLAESYRNAGADK